MAKVNSATLGADVTVDGVAPFSKVKDTRHGTFSIVDANGDAAPIYVSTDAVVGYQAATAETTPTVFAANANGEAIVDEIVAALPQV